jgi:hypothetical protein
LDNSTYNNLYGSIGFSTEILRQYSGTIMFQILFLRSFIMNDLLPLTAAEFENSTTDFVTVEVDGNDEVVFDLNSDELEVE